MMKFDDVLKEMSSLHGRKNHDYGDAFSKSFGEFGLLSAVVRMSDKMERLKVLCRGEARVDESICDTLIDLACYAVMTYVEMSRRIGFDMDKEKIDML